MRHNRREGSLVAEASNHLLVRARSRLFVCYSPIHAFTSTTLHGLGTHAYIAFSRFAHPFYLVSTILYILVSSSFSCLGHGKSSAAASVKSIPQFINKNCGAFTFYEVSWNATSNATGPGHDIMLASDSRPAPYEAPYVCVQYRKLMSLH